MAVPGTGFSESYASARRLCKSEFTTNPSRLHPKLGAIVRSRLFCPRPARPVRAGIGVVQRDSAGRWHSCSRRPARSDITFSALCRPPPELLLRGAASSPRSPPKNRITGLDSIAINEVMDCYKIILSSFARPALKSLFKDLTIKELYYSLAGRELGA